MFFAPKFSRTITISCCVMALVIPLSLCAQDCAEWSGATAPVVTFGEEYDHFSSSDHRYQMFTDSFLVYPDFYSYRSSLFDVGDPLNPTLVWQRTHGPNSIGMSYQFIFSFENLVVVALGCEFGIQELLIFDPRDESIVVSIEDPGWPAGQRGSIVWFTGGSNADLHSYDLGDWPVIAEVGSLELPAGGSPLRIGTTGAFFKPAGEEAVCFLDLSDPALPQILGCFELENNTEVGDAWAWDPDDAVLYLNDDEFLSAIDFRDPLNPLLLDRVKCADGIRGIKAYSDVGILFYWNDNFQVVSLQDPARLDLISDSIYELNNTSYQCVRRDDHFYIGCGSNGVALYDLADASTPVYVGRGEGTIYRLFSAGDRLLANGKAYLWDCSSVSAVSEPAARAGLFCRAWPNPSHGRTNFSFSLPGASPARLEIFDLRGRRVQDVSLGIRPLGEQEFAWEARDLPSGVFVYRLSTAWGESTGKLQLLR